MILCGIIKGVPKHELNLPLVSTGVRAGLHELILVRPKISSAYLCSQRNKLLGDRVTAISKKERGPRSFIENPRARRDC